MNTHKVVANLSNAYATCEYCDTTQKLGDVWSCKKCGAPMHPKEVKFLFTQEALVALTSAVPVDQMGVMTVDVSKWQGNIDFDVYVSSVAKYMLIKASQSNFADSKYQTNVTECLSRQLGFGFYHYLDPRYSISEAANFLASQVNTLTNGWEQAPNDPYFLYTPYGTKFRVFLDVESNLSATGTAYSPVVMESKIREFIRIFESLTRIKLGIYCRSSWWDSKVARNSWAHTRPLWVARYNTWIDDPGVPADWSNYGATWTLWQRSADGNGHGFIYGFESNSADETWFNGTQGEYEIWVGTVSIPVPPPVVSGCQLLRITSDDGLNFRARANDLSSTVYFSLPSGTDGIEVLDVLEFGNNQWARTGQRQYAAIVYNGVRYSEVYQE